MKVICVSGKAGHGKDTLARMLHHDLTYYVGFKGRTLVMHYADLLKFMLREYFGWDGQKDERGRKLLQKVGTEIVRAREPDYWVRFVADFMEMFSDMWDYVIIPDTRFPNELNYLKSRGFTVCHVRVVRDGYDSALTDEQQQHISETALDDVKPDIVVENNGSISDLKEKVTRSLLREVMEFEGNQAEWRCC